MRYDKVKVTADTVVHAAWRCRVCHTLQYSVGTVAVDTTCENTSPQEAKKAAAELLARRARELEKQFNQGYVRCINVSGLCKNCRAEQPWSSTAQAQARLPGLRRKQRRINALLIVSVAVLAVAALLVRDSMDPSLLFGCCFLGLMSIGAGWGMLTSRLREETRKLQQESIQGMIARKQADHFPLLAMAYDTLDTLPPEDERTQLLRRKVPADAHLDQKYSAEGSDTIDTFLSAGT